MDKGQYTITAKPLNEWDKTEFVSVELTLQLENEKRVFKGVLCL